MQLPGMNICANRKLLTCELTNKAGVYNLIKGDLFCFECEHVLQPLRNISVSFKGLQEGQNLSRSLSLCRRATVGEQMTHCQSLTERQKLGVAGRKNWSDPFCNIPHLPVLNACFYILFIRSPLASLLSCNIMPSEDEHLVFVIHRRHKHSGADIAVTGGHGSNRAVSVSFKLCLQFNDLFVFVVSGEHLLCFLSPSLPSSLSLCVSCSLTRSDSERSMPIGYVGGTE